MSQENQKRIVPETAIPKIYAMLISTSKGEILWQESAYSLENAFLQAKNTLKKIHFDVDFDTSKISLFNQVTLDEVLDSSKDIIQEEIPENVEVEVTYPSEKDKLMQEIIDSKNKELLEKNQEIFTEYEVKFLKDKLKKRSK